MNLIKDADLAKLVAKTVPPTDPKGAPVSTDRKQQIVDHIRGCPPETRDSLITQLLSAMTPDEVIFLKSALDLSPSADVPLQQTISAPAAQAVLAASTN